MLNSKKNLGGFTRQNFPRENLGGFTLIEMLIVISVLAAGIAAVLPAFPLGTHIQKSAQMSATAVQLSQAKMEEIISCQYNEIFVETVEEPYGFDSIAPSYKRTTEITYFDPDNPYVPLIEDSGIKRIEITVFYRSSFGISEKEVKLITLIAKR